MNDLTPFSTEVEEIVRSAKASPPIPDEIADRVESRIWSTLGLVPTSLPAPGNPPVVSGSTALKVMALGVVALTGGVVVWNANHAPPTQSPTQQPAAIETPKARAPIAAPNSEAITPEELAPPPKSASRQFNRLRRDGSPAPRENVSTLAEEERLIEQARRQLAEHNPQAAKAWLHQHAQKFPHGQLNEERDALQIRALFAVDKPDQATGALKKFRKNYPESVLLPTLESLETKANNR